MKTEKTDRRVKYTKMFLKNSLVDLMRDTPISKISVKMLCEAADINRSTFYAHFKDQYDLLEQLEQELIAELEKHLSDDVFPKQTGIKLQVLNQILIYISNNADLFRTLLSENGDFTFQREIMFLAQRKMISQLRHNQNIDARTSEYLQLFVVNGSLSIVQKWLQDGMVESTEKMSELSSKLLTNGLSAFFPNELL